MDSCDTLGIHTQNNNFPIVVFDLIVLLNAIYMPCDLG